MGVYVEAQVLMGQEAGAADAAQEGSQKWFGRLVIIPVRRVLCRGLAGLRPPSCLPDPHRRSRTCGISCRGSAWRVGHGGGVGCRAPPGRRALRSLHPTGSRWAPRGPYRPCPGLPGALNLRSWVPRGLAALVGSVRSGNSLEALLPHLPQTCQVTNQPPHTRTEMGGCDRAQSKHVAPTLSQSTDWQACQATGQTRTAGHS